MLVRGKYSQLSRWGLLESSSKAVKVSLPFICWLTARSLHISRQNCVVGCSTAVVHHVGAVPPQEAVPNCRLRAAALFLRPKHPHFRRLLVISSGLGEEWELLNTGQIYKRTFWDRNISWRYIICLGSKWRPCGTKFGERAKVEPAENQLCPSAFLRMLTSPNWAEAGGEKMAACCCCLAWKQ